MPSSLPSPGGVNLALVRVLASYGFAYTADWAFTVAIALVAYADGGAFTVGLIGILRLLPSALLGPVVATYADRLPRARLLAVSATLSATATLAAAPVLLADGPVVVVYALAVVSTMAFTPYRAGHAALLPLLCHHPDELVRVNVARGALFSGSLALGPLIAAMLVGVGDVASVFWFAGACNLVAAVLVLHLDRDRQPVASPGHSHLRAAVREGLSAVHSSHDVRAVVRAVLLHTAIRGAVTVFVVVIALDLLESGDSTVGLLQGAMGVGALVGSLGSTLLVGSRAMARWLGVAVVLWGLPLAVVGLAPHALVALLMFGAIGLGITMSDVTGYTLLARLVPETLQARVYAVRESLGSLGVCVGSALAPALIGLLGARDALLVVGAAAPVACAAWWRTFTTIDRTVWVRTEVITMLRRVPMLHVLAIPAIEQLAHGVETVDVPAGRTVFEAGDVGDSFYVIAQGEVEILDHLRVVGTMRTGQGFGEIALLGGTTRTMTVRTTQWTRLFALHASTFVPAVSRTRQAWATAVATGRQHLANAPGLADRNRGGIPPGY